MAILWHKSSAGGVQGWTFLSGAGRLGQVWHKSSAAGQLGFLVRLLFISPQKSVVDSLDATTTKTLQIKGSYNKNW